MLGTDWENITPEQLERKREANRITQWKQGQTKQGLARQVAIVRKNVLKRKNRVPVWSEDEAIREFYQNCPEGYHVDHDWPLCGELVSGIACIKQS